MKTGILISGLAVLIVMAGFAPLQAYVWEGFEKENLWFISAEENNAVDNLSLVKSNKTEGEQALEITLGPGILDSNGVISREGLMDFSGIKEVSFDVYIERPVAMAIAFSTGDNYTYYESKDFKLKRGWNKNLSIKLASKEFKSALSGYKMYNDAPAELNKTKKLMFMFKKGFKSKVLMDNIQFDGKKINNDAYSLKPMVIDQKKMVNEYSLLENLVPAGWAKQYSTGNKIENNVYVLNYQEVDNVNKASYKVQMDMDWSPYAKLLIKAKNIGDKGCTLALGISTGEGWAWHESPQFLQKPGSSSEVVLNLDAPYFKTSDSSWQNVVNLKEKNNIKEVNLIIYGLYGSKSTGKIQIEEFKLLPTN